MAYFLISTKRDDTHARAVAAALAIDGHKAIRWFGSEFPEQQKISFRMKDREISWGIEANDCAVNSHQHIDTFWFRRPTRPSLPSSVHPDDREFVEKENLTFFKSIWPAFLKNSFWVNPYESRELVNSKLAQLQCAMNIGFTVPETLISNNPVEIREFVGKATEESVHKTFSPNFWRTEKGIALTSTNRVTLTNLPEDNVLQNTSGIYQRMVLKAFELRVTFFGQYPICVKINSQIHPRGGIDWRKIPTYHLEIEPFDLPSEIKSSCITFMQHFGIVFGCFDFIVTPRGEFIFLEVNEMGQFLWVEEVNPAIPMLNTFREFLLSQRPDFNSTDCRKGDGISLLDIYKSEVYSAILKCDQQLGL